MTRNWFVVSKLAWDIWQALAWALTIDTLMGSFWTKYMLKSKEELCLVALKIDAKFEGKLTFAFQNGMRKLANFHSLKNNDIILQSKMTELNQNKNSKQLDRPDEFRPFRWTLSYLWDKWIAQLTKLVRHVLQNRCF